MNIKNQSLCLIRQMLRKWKSWVGSSKTIKIINPATGSNYWRKFQILERRKHQMQLDAACKLHLEVGQN